jgi:hypothetical protein
MIQLPSNATTAALAMLLGALLGAGGTWYVLHEPAPTLPEVQGERQGILERDRPLAPADTAGSEGPDLEIRYRTRTDTVLRTKRDTVVATDTVVVSAPLSLTRAPQLLPDRYLQMRGDRVRVTRYDVQGQRYEQDVYALPDRTDRWRFSLYGLAGSRWHLQGGPPGRTIRGGVGARLWHDPPWMMGALELYGEAHTSLVRAGYTAGLRWHFVRF